MGLLVKFSFVVLASACTATVSPGLDAGLEEESLPDADSVDAIGTLLMLNHEEADWFFQHSELPVEVINNVLAARDGEDGVLSTGDDQPYLSLESVEQVDGVQRETVLEFVTLAQLMEFTDSTSPNIVEGVHLPIELHDEILDLANGLSPAGLQYDVELSKVSADDIVAARPHQVLMPLARGVKTTELHAFRRYIQSPRTSGHACASTLDCTDETICTGIVEGVGRCHGRDYIEGEGNSCSSQSCGKELFCVGLTLWPDGFCVPAWMNDTFSTLGGNDIPDGVSSLESDVLVFGLATVPMDIQVEFEVSHPRPGDLKIELDDPNGQIARPMVAVVDGVNRVTIFQNSRDDRVNGYWTLRVIDQVPGEQGRLLRWSLSVSSRWD